PTTPIIEDWVFDSEDESKTKAPQIIPSFIQSSEQVKSPKHSVQPLETSISTTTPKLASPKSASSGKKILTQSKPVSITAVRPVSAVVSKIKGNPQHTLKDKGVIDSGCSRSMTRNMSYLSDFEELNSGYVAFGGDPKGGKFEGKVDEGFLVGYSVSSKAFRVFNSRTYIVQETLHVNFLENKPNVPGSGPTWLFDIDSLTRTMNYQPVTARNQTNPSAGFQDKFDAKKAGEKIDQQYVLFPVWFSGSTNPQNNDGDDAFDGMEHNFDTKKHESEVSVFPSSSAQSRKQDDKTKKEAKGKSYVESFTGYRDLIAEFEDCSDNNINEVNAVGSIVPTVGQNSLNSTNTFSIAGSSKAAASPTYGKSSFIDASQLPDDPDMSELEDITYFDDENDVGAEADFNNLETSITEEPKRVHQALKDPSWIEVIQEGLLQFKMQKVWVLVDLPHRKRAIVARIKAIRLFLAYASFMGFMVYQMDVKSAFIYGTIEEEVYLCQPSWCEDPDHPDKVYKVVKELYGLHQAPRA
nr:hypothetical protein [Tanacetum cinerariifolium]